MPRKAKKAKSAEINPFDILAEMINLLRYLSLQQRQLALEILSHTVKSDVEVNK